MTEVLNSLQPGRFAWLQVFSATPDAGNPTLVVQLSAWPETGWLARAAETLAVREITFFVIERGALQIRWFSGPREVPFCGHGALAVGYVLSGHARRELLVPVANCSRALWVGSDGSRSCLVTPVTPLRRLPVDTIDLGTRVVSLFDAGRDYLAILPDERSVAEYKPEAHGLEGLDKLGIIIAAPSSSALAAFRFFAPRAGISEDAASGSVIPTLMAHWPSQEGVSCRFDQHSPAKVSIVARRTDRSVTVLGDICRVAEGTLLLTHQSGVP